MSINSTLKKEGIENIKPLGVLEINKIASNIAEKLSSAFPEHKINKSDLFISIARLNMYTATMPSDHSAAKYFYKNNSIYFSENTNIDNINSLALHESIHYIQEVRNKSGHLVRMGLYDMTGKGMAINEAAVQLMASIANSNNLESVKYYDLNLYTESPDYYPIECALIKQMQFFTGSYPLFHSTLYGDDIFKNTFITKTSPKVYQKVEYNFDLLVRYEELLSQEIYNLMLQSDSSKNLNKIKSINIRISNIKKIISKIALETQELISVNCFLSEFELIKNLDSLQEFKQKLLNFKNLLIGNDNYYFYEDLCNYMNNKLYEKEQLILQYGEIYYLTEFETSLTPTISSLPKYIHTFFQKYKLLFENYKYIINKE